MYVIKNDHRNAFKTYDGWTTVEDKVLTGLQNVIRFTAHEAELNQAKLPSGSRFVYFPRRRWKDLP